MAQKNAKNGGGGSQTSSSGNEAERSAQEILQLGQSAAEALQSPIFNTMYNLRLQEVFSEWLNTEPKEEKRRESLFYEARGLVELTLRMEGLVQEAKTILEERQYQQSPEFQQNQYLDDQGFGINP